MKKILPIIILLLIGLTILGGYIFPGALGPLLSLLVDWAVILIGAAGLFGIGYLVRKHTEVIARKEKRIFLSITLLTAFAFTLIFGLILSIDNPIFVDLLINVQIPVETSLLAILAVVLMTASFRLISTRGWTPMSISFLVGAVMSLALNVAVVNLNLSATGSAILNFLRRLPLVGARGILLGMALGGLIIGLRVLLTIDKPHGE